MLLKILHWDVITPRANPLLKLKLIITLLLIVISWQINLIIFSQMLVQSLQIKCQKLMVIFQIIWTVISEKVCVSFIPNLMKLSGLLISWNIVLVKWLRRCHHWLQTKVINELSLSLSIIFNKSFELGQFPDRLKIAKIIPILKSEDKLLISNYHLIWILSFFSKILERLMYNRLLNYLPLTKF